MEETEAITFECILNCAKTTVDGGWRISFDVDAKQADAILRLSKLRDCVLAVAIVPQPSDEDCLSNISDL